MLNMLGGIFGAIWLAVVGNWGTPLLAFTVSVGATYPLGLAMLPGTLLAARAVALGERRVVLGFPFILASNAWNYGVVAIWCSGVFAWLLARSQGQHLLPTLLLAYSTATSSWSYVVRKQQGSDPEGTSVYQILFCQLGCALLLVLAAVKGGADQSLLLGVMVPTMALGIVWQVTLAYAFMVRRRRFA